MALPTPEKKGRGKAIAGAGLLLGVIALGVVGLLGFRALRGDGGGAASPEAAVDDLSESFLNGQILGSASLLPPSEVAYFDDAWNSDIAQLFREETVAGAIEDSMNNNDSFEGNPFDALEEFTNAYNVELEYDSEVEMLHPDVAKVYIRGGTMTFEFDGADLSDDLIEDFVDDPAEAAEVRETTVFARATLDSDLCLDWEFTITGPEAASDSGNDCADDFNSDDFNMDGDGITGVYFMSIREGGRWYVSPMYTMAEYAREALGAGPADFTASRENASGGSDSASEAFEAFLDASADGDVEEILATLNPDEFPVVHDYFVAFESDIRDSLGDFDDRLDGRFENLELVETSAITGGTRVTMVEGEGEFSWLDDFGDTVTVEFELREGTCGRSRTTVTFQDGFVDADDWTAEECAEAEFDAAIDDLREQGGRCRLSEVIREECDGDSLMVDGELTFEDLDLPGFVTVVTQESGGGHYVSPIATMEEWAVIFTNGAEQLLEVE